MTFVSAEYVCHNLFNYPLILGILLFPNFSLGWYDDNPCMYISMYIINYGPRINYEKNHY